MTNISNSLSQSATIVEATTCSENESESTSELTPPEELPHDRLNMVFFIFFFFGCSSLVAWNMFITVSFDYYEAFKLQYNGKSNWYSDNFQNAMTICAQLPSVLFCVLSVFKDLRGNLPYRMQVSLIISEIVLLITMALIYIKTEIWLTTFFIFTLLTIVILNASIGVFQNSMFGLVGTFPFKYTNAVIIGQNFNGIFITCLSIVSKLVSNDAQMSAFLFFGIAFLILLACMLLLLFVQKNKFYKKFGVLEKISSQRSKKETAQKTRENLASVFKLAKWQFLNVYLLFFVTLSMFPNITLYVRPGKSENFIVPAKFYNDVVTFLNFSVFAFIGNLVANYIKFPGPKWIWIAVLARFWFVIYFPLCNYHPEMRRFPVIFSSTWLFIGNQSLLALSSGYLSSLIMMYAPKTCAEPHLQRLAGMISLVFLLFGIMSGLVFSWIVKLVVLK